MKESPSYEKMFELQKKADQVLRENWLENVLFTYRWWIALALAVVPWLLWWKLVDRQRLFEIMTYGFMVMVVSIIFDAVGVEFDLWEYKYRLVPLLDVFIEYDIAVMPVVYMLVYQYFNSWKSFVMAHIVLAAVFAFAAEPLLVWMGYYVLINWEYIYSFPIYLAIAVALRWVMIKLRLAVNKAA